MKTVDVIIPCLYLTDEQITLVDMDINVSPEDNEIRRVRFFSIAALSTCKFKGDESGIEYGVVHCNGTTFVSSLNIVEVEGLINGNHYLDKDMKAVKCTYPKDLKSKISSYGTNI